MGLVRQRGVNRELRLPVADRPGMTAPETERGWEGGKGARGGETGGRGETGGERAIANWEDHLPGGQRATIYICLVFLSLLMIQYNAPHNIISNIARGTTDPGY